MWHYAAPSLARRPAPSLLRCIATAVVSSACFSSPSPTPRRWCGHDAGRSGSTEMQNKGETTQTSAAASATTTTAQAPPRRKVQIAVVGSGPSGCFVASQLIKKHPELHVDVFERLPVPFGLCRYGVAPDHPDVKNVEKQFLELFQSERVTWMGNLSVGKDIPLQALLAHYAAVVLATGADGSKKLSIPGEDLGGVLPARSFVEYYNTYPFPYGSPRFCPFDLERTRRAVVIGNGNVAMDVVRVLAGSYKYLCPTDMNCVCIKELMKNRIEEISVVARRGVEHSAFATAEFRELTSYQGDRVRVEVDHFDLAAAVAARPESRTMRAHKRLMELVHRYALTYEETAAEAERLATDARGVSHLSASTSSAVTAAAHGSDPRGTCRLRFRYDLTPIAILSNPYRRNYVGGVLFRKTRSRDSDGVPAVVPDEKTEEYCVVPCDLVLTSIGYRADSIAGVPFNHRAGVIEQEQGRVKKLPRVYCTGWAKTGAKGVILHSVADAQETVATLLEDMAAGVVPTTATAPLEDEDVDAASFTSSAQTLDGESAELLSPGSSSSQGQRPGNGAGNEHATASANTTTMYGKYGLVDYFISKGLQPVSVAGLQRILFVEQQRGVDLGKKAEKVDTIRDMLDIALGGDVGRKANERVRRITPARSDAMLYLKELLDDETDLSSFARELARDVPRRMAQQHPPGPISPGQL